MPSKPKTTAPEEEAKPALVPKLQFPEFRGKEGWKLKKLSTSVQLVSGMHLSPEQYGKEGAVPYFTGPSDFTNDAKAITKRTSDSTSLAQANDTLITVKGSGVGEIWYLTLPSVAMGRQLMAVRSVCAVSGFTFQFLLTKRRRFEDLAAGNLIPGLSRGNILDLEAPFPPLAEQQKIAECLSSVDELMAAQSRKVDALKTHKKGLMQQLFPRKGETQPRLRFPEFQNAGEWTTEPLGELASYQNGKAYEKDITEAGKYVVVNSRFISTDGAVRKYTNADHLIAEAGEVLMVLSDLPKGKALAKCYFVEANDHYAVNQRVCRLTPKRIEGKFLYYALNRHPRLLAFDDGLNQTHLSKGCVTECPLCVPGGKDEQHRIASCISSLDALIAAETQKHEALKAHKNGLMQQLFPSPEEA